MAKPEENQDLRPVKSIVKSEEKPNTEMQDIDIKNEPLPYDNNGIVEFEEVLGSEGVITNTSVIKAEVGKEEQNDTDIRDEPEPYDSDDIDLFYVGLHGTSPSSSKSATDAFAEELKDECNADIKYEPPDSGLGRNITNISQKHFDCSKCSYQTPRNYDLKRHIMLIHDKHETPRYKCDKCSHKSKTKTRLKTHVKFVHEKYKAPQYNCDLCSYQTIDKDYLRKHMRVHTGPLIECVLCQKAFRYKQQLDKHYVSKHWDQNESFKHLLTHKIKQCSRCFFVCITSDMLKRHLSKHEENGDKFKVKCYICGYKCIAKGALKVHLRLHSGYLPFLCLECNKKFNTKVELDRHIVSRHGKNELLMATVTSTIHQCPKCTYKAVSPFVFKRHMEKHKKIVPID